MKKKGNQQKLLESEKISASITWTESSGEEYTGISFKKVGQKSKATTKDNGKKVVPQDYDTPPPKRPTRKNMTISPSYKQILCDDNDIKAESS